MDSVPRMDEILIDVFRDEETGYWVGLMLPQQEMRAGRSLASVEASFRWKLKRDGEHPDVPIRLRLAERDAGRPALVEARLAAAREATRALERLAHWTREVVQALLAEPSMSVRDVAKLTGVARSRVQEIAAELGIDGKARASARMLAAAERARTKREMLLSHT